MIQLERLLDLSHPIDVRGECCTHRWNKESACSLCLDGCPTQALALEEGEIVLDETRCVRCEFCFRVCPTDVFHGSNEAVMLLKSVAALSPRRSLSLACINEGVTDAAIAADAEAVVQLRTCLASLGRAAYAGLAALGVEAIHVRLDQCETCPLGTLRPHIEAVCREAQALVEIDVTVDGEIDPEFEPARAEPDSRPVVRTYQPKVSRRAFLRRPASAAQVPDDLLPSEPTADKTPPVERRFLLHFLEQIPASRRGDGTFLPDIGVTDSCTACGVCATVCPNGALELEKELTPEQEHFRLNFDPASCTACNLCVELCPPQALAFTGARSLKEAEPVTLLAGDLKRCKRCRAHFAGPGTLCPACDFRRKNPFGSVPRPFVFPV
ncbi:MAG: 4Fe-4S binding protein [Caldilineaceae bacterium]|nr:4Fe-4S binding protein [Caldilineaceae bacterium]